MLYIKISYETGNTFGSFEETLTLDQTWMKPEIVTENMKRIWDHYNWYSAKNSSYQDPVPEPEWQERLSHKTHKDYNDWYVLLQNDDETEFEYYASAWIGYFESLVDVSITMDRP
jgi:hypothetical protein